MPRPRPRRRLIVAAVAAATVLIVVGGAYAAQRLADDSPSRWPSTRLGADEVVVYKPSAKRDLHLHLFAPEAPATTAVVFFHGGGLQRTPLDQFVNQAEALRARGAFVAIAEYRVSWDGTGSSDARADAADAVGWLRAQAEEYGFPPAAIVAAGASAGGMLAASTATIDDPTRRSDALLLFNPAVNSSSAGDGEVPALVMHGDSDRLVALSSAQGYCDALEECEMMIWPGGDHGFFNTGDAYDATLARSIEFLVARGLLK